MGKQSTLQRIFGAQFMDPPSFKENAGAANQFGGRTTLSSGSATVTVSTALVNSDSVIFLSDEGNTAFGHLVGTSFVASGDVIATVSNAAIVADSLVFLTQIASATNQTSGAEAFLEIKSLAAGSMGIGFAGGQNPRASRSYFNFMVTPSDGIPSPIEVRSISSGNFFTIGRSDNRGAARDTTVMWFLMGTSQM